MAIKDKQSRVITLPICEKDYALFERDIPKAHEVIGDCLKKHPDCFPALIHKKGYALHGRDRLSKKLGIRLRRIKIDGIIYRIRPIFVLSYMRGKVNKDTSNALLLIRFGVPFWVIAYIFGRNAMYWYRLFISLAEFNLVATTVYNKDKMPHHILADEFHIRLKGLKAYIATVVAQSCFLCMEACAQANEKALSTAYGVFKREAQYLIPDFQPISINTDGWWATQNALKALFPKAHIIECFLHAVIKFRDRATKALSEFYTQAADRVWEIYRAENKRKMAQQIRRLKEWTDRIVPRSAMKDNLLKLCAKKNKWLAHFDTPSAYRTSAQLDRVMKNMERHAINSQMFHSTISMTSKNFRAFALIYNFSPSCPAVTKKYPDLISPAARLNEFVYSQDWFQNMLIAAAKARR